jgi:ABC-2 type transport system permease protein
MRGLLRLTWLEAKIFVREPLGFISSVIVPIAMFLILGRSFGSGPTRSPGAQQFLARDLPLFISIFISINAALSLVAVISVYREGGILKRLRATPLKPATILGAHVLVKLMFTGLSLVLLWFAGRRYSPVPLEAHVGAFAIAVVVTTVAILTMGFVVASMVTTARFAQLIGSLVFYPMLAISGMLVPLSAMPRPWPQIGAVLPMTHAVALLRGAWAGESWLAMGPHLGALALTIVVCLALTSRVFRWE